MSILGFVTALAATFDPVAATNEYLAKLPPETMAKSIAYNNSEHWIAVGTFVFTSAIYLVLLASGLSARMARFAERVVGARTNEGVSTGRRVWLVPLIYVALFVLLNTAIQFPLSIYTGYFREHSYGMSNQTLPEWFKDEAKGLAIGLVVASLGAIVLYAVLRRVGRNWWIWTSALFIGFAALGAMFAPVYLAPLFNTYKSLPDSELRTQLLSLAKANQIPADDIYVFDASKQTKRVSANVSGMFGTTRISLNDNLLNRCSPAAVRGVMAHEMGHYVLNHSLKGLTQHGLVIAIGLGLVALAFERIAGKFGRAWGIHTVDGNAGRAVGVADPAALPLLLLLLGIYGFVTMPLGNTITRTAEIEADAFGLNAAREPDGMAEALLTLVEYRNPKPGKWEEIIFFDHPSGYNRILAAMTWKAENMPATSEATSAPESDKQPSATSK